MACCKRLAFFRCSLLLACCWVTQLCLASEEQNINLSQQSLDKLINQAAEKAAKDTADKLLKQLKTDKDASEPAAEQTAPVEAAPIAPEKATATIYNTNLVSIGSGSVGGNYFVLGELVGGVISHPHGSLPCEAGGTCGVPHLQSLNITSAGSMANLSAIADNKIASGFVQSDVAYWAYTGTGLFENKNKMEDLRAIASLYPEAVHIVIKKNTGIKSLSDLKGKRVSVGARKSGTLLQSRLVLGAYNLTEDDLQTEYLNNQQSIEKLQAGELDAMFFSVGVPAPSLTKLFSDSKDFTLLSISSDARQHIFKQGSYFSPYAIEENTYPNVQTVDTISVFALWLCASEQDEELVYQMTKALWHDNSRQLLDSSYIGRQITIENSLQGIGIPLHRGAKKYYNEIGKRF